MAPRRVGPALTDLDGQDDDQDMLQRANGADDDQQDDQDDDSQDDQDDDQDDDQQDDQQDDVGRRRVVARDDDSEVAELRRERDELRRRAEEAERRVTAPAAVAAESPEQEAQRLALMTPEERIEYRMERAQRENRAAMQRVELNAANTADSASFRVFMQEHPQFSKLSSEVERRHSEMVAKGQYPTRETVLKFLLGERALEATRSGNTRKSSRERERRVQRQQARPLDNNRSDVSSQRRRGGQSLEERLENVQI